MDVLFAGVRAPSTLGSHLLSYTWGNVLQLELWRLPTQRPYACGADEEPGLVGVNETVGSVRDLGCRPPMRLP